MAKNEEEEKQKDAPHTVDVEISVVLGKSSLRVNQLLKLARGAVVELEQKTSDPVEIYANGARRGRCDRRRQNRRHVDGTGQVDLFQ